MEWMGILVFALFIFILVKNIGQWIQNENAPRLTVDAMIVDKRRATHHHHAGGHHHHSHSYHVTFQMDSGDRMELRVRRDEYGVLEVGEQGRLSFQGTRYLGFERKDGAAE